MKLILESPVKLRIEDITDAELQSLKKLLTYKDKTVEYEIKKTKNSYWMMNQLGPERMAELLEEKKRNLWKTILYVDETGIWTLSGLKDLIIQNFKYATFKNDVEYPEFKLIPWATKPPYSPLKPQQQCIDSFLANSHSRASVATGVGKTFIAVMMAKLTGLPTIIATPSASIARQFYSELTEYFGKQKVGLFGDGKKEVGKHILVAINKSLGMVKDPEIAEKLKNYKVLISDESHGTPSDTNEYWVTGSCAHIPYRWFLSATQVRNDGKDLILDGITGPEVFEYSIQQGISDGFLAKLNFKIFDVWSHSDYSNRNNTVKLNQEHIYKNPQITQLVAQLANTALDADMPVLILIDEIMQESALKGLIKHEYAFAEGKADTYQMCKDFNSGKVKCIIGTSAVSTGTNFKPLKLTINWQGNASEVKVKQGPIGRSTRIDKNKTECTIVDFRITNVPTLERHADTRISIYEEIAPVQIIKT